jgi:hypothetical protein
MMVKTGVEEGAVARMDHLAELLKETRGGQRAMSKNRTTVVEEVTEGVESMEKGWIRTRPAKRILGKRLKQVRQI